MKAILLQTKTMDNAVLNLILDKQLAFRKEKNRCVSLEYTINRMLKEGYKNEIEVSTLGKEK